MLPAGVLLLLFLTYPLGLGTWLGFTDTKIGRAGMWVGLDNFKYLVRRRGRAALALQHALLHDRRERRQVRARAVAGAPAQPAHAVQVVLPRRGAAALHRAHGALGDRLLVDLRRAVLGDLAGRS